MKKLCDICNTLIGTGPFEKHYNRCDGIGTRRATRNIFERIGDVSKCPVCFKMFSPNGVQTHFRSAHGDKTAFTKECPKCNTFYKTCNFDKHFKYCGSAKRKNKYFERVEDKSKCPICEKLFSPIGVQAHYRIIHEGRTNHSLPNWKPSNGAIKAKEEGREFIVSASQRKKNSEAVLRRTKEFNIAQGKEVQKTVSNKVALGEWHAGKTKKFEYNGIKLDGNWELQYAKFLDKNNVKWMRPTQSFQYEFEGKKHNYFPDFYLTELNEYVEIKGRERPKDIAKQIQFPHKLTVLRFKDLKLLGLDIH